MLFIDADYERKEWCGLEWRAVRDLLKRGQLAAIMLVRFDTTEIPGLFSTDGYVSVGDRTPEEIARLILQRLETNAGAATAVVSGIAQSSRSTGAAARALWEKKLDFLTAEEARAADPAQKFQLRELIEEARGKIREYGGAG